MNKTKNKNKAKKAMKSLPHVVDVEETESPIQTYTQDGMKLLVQASKAVLALPSGSSRDLYTAHPSFGKIMDHQGLQILSIISDVMKLQQIKGNIIRRDREEKFDLLQECNDAMLERISSNLDEMEGVKKKDETVLVHTELQLAPEPNHKASGSWNERHRKSHQSVTATLITGTNIVRPQIYFKVPVDNSALTPFVPRISEKPNSIKPLAILPEYDDAGNIVTYLHPYEFELAKFSVPKPQLCKTGAKKPLPIEDTPLEYVDNIEDLEKMVTELSAVNEIAVDLEHHSYRTYQGFTCLLQISTREKDYIIDTLALREELQILNVIFTNPKVAKVFHGAQHDIEWLQRDLSLYVVNMFDTGEAGRILDFSRLGLQYLLKHYCDIETDKSFQLADWRIRPIPEDFLEYARKDTHYLLYIYDCMRNELIQKGANFLRAVYDKSTWICQQKYIKPSIDEDFIMNIYRRSKHVFDQRQMYAFREILYWRDKIARHEDESTGYVLPQHMALDISSKLPREMHGILACCTPIPSLVRQHLHTLHQIVLKAREKPVTKALVAPEQQQQDQRDKMQTTFDLNNPLYCPHDSAHGYDAHTNLPTLLDSSKQSPANEKKSKKLIKENVDVALFKQSKNHFFDSQMNMLAGGNIMDNIRLAKMVQRECSEKSSMEQNIIPITRLGYKDRKFNTPYQRHVETCKNKYINEIIEVIPPNSVQTAEENEIQNESIVSVPDSANDESIYSSSMSLTSMKSMKNKRKRQEALDKPHEKKIKVEEVVEEKIVPNESLRMKAVMEATNEEDNVVATPTRNRESKKKNKFKKNKVSSKSFRQSSNTAIPFDYDKVDYSRFQGGSQQPNSQNKKSDKKHLNKNSKLGKSIAKCQKMFNFSSNNLQKK